MKVLKGLSLAAVLLGVLSGCVGMDDSSLVGELTINPKSGWSKIKLIDNRTDQPFEIGPGIYRLDFVEGFYGFTSPRLRISWQSGKIIGEFAIPRSAFNETLDGFELYSNSQEKNNYQYNILGGRRKMTRSLIRYAKPHQHCTYRESYSCTKTDSRGKSYTGTCTRTRSGHRDELWEDETYILAYRILFESYDYVNIAQWKSDSGLRSDSRRIDSDSCR